MKNARALSVRTSPGWPVLFAFLVVAVLTLELGLSASTRVGIQVTPLSWVGLISLTVAVSGLFRLQFPSHTADSANLKPGAQGNDAIDAAFSAWKSTAEILDARTTFPEFLYPAHKASLAIFPSGTTFLAARFATPAAARAAVEGYREFFGMTDSRASLQATWTGARAQTHDFASIRCQGDLLLACTTRERANLDPRLVLSIASASAAVHF